MDSQAMLRMCKNDKGKNVIEIHQLVGGTMNNITISLSDLPQFLFMLNSLHNNLKINTQSQEMRKRKQHSSKREEEKGDDETSAKKKSLLYEPTSLPDNLQEQNHEQYDPVTNFKIDTMFTSDVKMKEEENPLVIPFDTLLDQHPEQYNPLTNFKLDDIFTSDVKKEEKLSIIPPDALQEHNCKQYNSATNFEMNSLFSIAAEMKEEKPLKEKILDIICYLFCCQYSETVRMQCAGCKINNLDPRTHNICKLSRKNRIELVFNDVFNNISDDAIMQALGCSHADYIQKDVLIKNSNWVKKLKTKINHHL